MIRAFLLAVCLTLSVSAQFVVDPYRFGLPGPSTISGIRYYWVSEDLAQGVVTANWIDRINGYGIGNSTGAGQPTNTTSGVHFNGAQFLTNSPVFDPTTNTVPLPGQTVGGYWIVLAPTTPAGLFGCFVASDAGAFGLYVTSGGIWRIFGECGSPTWGAYSSGTKYDLAVNDTSCGTNAFYLNGSLSSSGVTAGFYNNVSDIGRQHNGLLPFKGYILEIAFFSRQLTAAEITTLHAYAAAKYTY